MVTIAITSEELLESGIIEIGVQLEDTKRVSVYVSKVSSLPSGISPPEGNIYAYIEIVFVEFGTTNKLEPSGYIKFKISKKWMESKGVKSSDIQFLKYSEDKWIELSGELIDEDSDYSYFKVNLESFSLFAVVAKSKVSIPAIPPPTPEKSPEEVAMEEITTPAKPTSEKPPEKEEFSLIYAAGGLLILVAVIIAVLLKRKS